jgi:hypothetical protein
MSNQVDAIEERTAVCGPLVDRCLIPVAVAVSWALTFSASASTFLVIIIVAIVTSF